MEFLLAALVLGLMGSLHCIGMCGPIALSLPLSSTSFMQRTIGALVYNIGRTLMYGVMGAMFGLLGMGFHLAGYQKWVSIAMGVLMILTILVPKLFYSSSDNAFNRWVRKNMQQLFASASTGKLFLIGALNSLLPCGLVYMAIAGAVGTGHVLTGALFMIVFGLGTIPMLLAVSLLGNVISLGLRQQLNKLIPYLVVFMGMLFILRGLTLGIPYLSPPPEKLKPEMHMNKTEVSHACCKKQ